MGGCCGSSKPSSSKHGGDVIPPISLHKNSQNDQKNLIQNPKLNGPSEKSVDNTNNNNASSSFPSLQKIQILIIYKDFVSKQEIVVHQVINNGAGLISNKEEQLNQKEPDHKVIEEGQIHLQFQPHQIQEVKLSTEDPIPNTLAQKDTLKNNVPLATGKRPPISMKQNGIEDGIDKIDDILVSKSKNIENSSQKARASLHRDNYQQATNNILGRNDIFIFSNNGGSPVKKQSKFSSSIYCCLNEKEMKMQGIPESSKYLTKSTNGSIQGESNSSPFSAFQDWSKLIEKYSTVQATKATDRESKQKANPFTEIYQAIVTMKERAWYDELAIFFKEKNGANKININMQETFFYKKITLIQDQFRWLVSSVANVVFNFQASPSMFEFPSQSSSSLKKRKTSSLNSASGNRNSQSEKSDGQPENQNTKQIGSQQTTTQQTVPTFLLTSNKTSGENQNTLNEVLPDSHSPLWIKGFIWKGVYFRLISKKKAKHLKGEIRALKHIGLEYLQSDPSICVTAANGTNQKLYFNFMLPLLCYVETSSFILYGTPLVQTKQNTQEEAIARSSGFNIFNHFSSCFLMRNMKEHNLVLFLKQQEQQAPAGNSQPITNINYIIQNVKDLVPRHSETHQIFMISQDINQNVQFFPPIKEGFVEINQIKSTLGYSEIDFKWGALNYNQSKYEKQMQEDLQYQNQQFSRSCIHKLDQLSFKKHGWSFKMIFMSQYDSKRFNINKKASDLISVATNKSKEIKNVYGNVLIFAKNLNSNSLILPALIHNEKTHSILFSQSSEKEKQQQPKTFFAIDFNDSRDEYLAKIYKEQITSIVKELDFNDSIIHSKSLTELFHKKGINIRLCSAVLPLLQTEKAKILISCEIFARVLKSIVQESTSLVFKRLNSQEAQKQIKQSSTQEDPEKNDLLSEILFKTIFARYFGLILKGDPINEDIAVNQEVSFGINLFRLKSISFARLILSQSEQSSFLSHKFIKDIVSISQSNTNIFLQTCQNHFGFSLLTETERNIRNDKYYFTIRSSIFKSQDISYINFRSIPYLTIKELASLFLIKLSQSNIEKQILLTIPDLIDLVRYVQIQLPSSLYKTVSDSSNGILSNAYYMPTGETLKDLVSYLSCIFGNTFSINQEQNFFLELYIFQLFDSFFIGKDDEELIRNVMNEKIQPFLQNAYAISAELSIIVYTWFGILQESKSLLECEQSYLMALLGIHKLYGDPRGRGSVTIPWEMFITWRLSIIARLQGKKHDAEYVEELYDSVQFGLQKNIFNSFKFKSKIYSDPFQLVDKNSSNESANKKKAEAQDNLNSIPFSHWTEYQNLDENSPIMEVLTSTLRKNQNLLPWMMKNLLFFQEGGLLWETTSLRSFQLSLMQNTFQANSSCSSVSSSDKLDTPKSSKVEPKSKIFVPQNQSGNIVQIIEKDFSTFSKRDAVGVLFSWGQNTQGQMGNVFLDPGQSSLSKKIKINFPKLIIPLKETIITSVACGYQHSTAITYCGNVLAWGDNSHSQLGLGKEFPSSVPYPCPVPGLQDIISVQCGSEHSLALDINGSVFSWGNGEGGLLGHGNEDVQSIPKEIETLKGQGVEFIVCGGLHSLVLTKNRHVYSWGRNEGGQLGIERKYFTNEKCYITLPQRVRGNLEGVGVIQIAAGEAHSLALALNGTIYGWGYNMNGQIGLGEQQEAYPVYEPVLIPKMQKIEKIYAGQTFSMFMNQQKEIFCCGLNDSNQLGLEKEPIKIPGSGNEVFLPKKMECFSQKPVLHVSCGHNHSLAFVVLESKHYMLFAWGNTGMHKHGQLGIGETGQQSSVPRPITYLQDVTTYSMACGSYHSLVVANDINRILKKEQVRVIKEGLDKFDSKWTICLQNWQTTSKISEFIVGENDNFAPSEEGKIDNPKASKRNSSFNALGVQFS